MKELKHEIYKVSVSEETGFDGDECINLGYCDLFLVATSKEDALERFIRICCVAGDDEDPRIIRKSYDTRDGDVKVKRVGKAMEMKTKLSYSVKGDR